MVRFLVNHPRVILTGLALLAVGGTGTGVALQRPASGADRQAPPAALGSVSCLGSVDVDGGPTALAPQHPGRVTELLVREGEAVQRGAVLVRLDDGEARIAVEQAEAAVKAARLRAEQAKRE